MIKPEIFACVLRDVCEVMEISERDIISRSRSEEVVDALAYAAMANNRGNEPMAAMAMMNGGNCQDLKTLDANLNCDFNNNLQAGVCAVRAPIEQVTGQVGFFAEEVEAMRSGAEQTLTSVERQWEFLDNAGALLSELNPAYKEKRENDKRFDDMESSINELKDLVRQLAAKV